MKNSQLELIDSFSDDWEGGWPISVEPATDAIFLKRGDETTTFKFINGKFKKTNKEVRKIKPGN